MRYGSGTMRASMASDERDACSRRPGAYASTGEEEEAQDQEEEISTQTLTKREETEQEGSQRERE